MAEGKSKNREKQKKSISFATGCVFCSVRAPVIRHSRKLALRLRHFARWRKLARTSLRKPRHYRLTDRLFLCFVSILQEITCESEISAASGTSKGAVSSQSRKPRHYRLTDRLFLCFVSILQEITCESEISAASGTSKGAVSSQSVTVSLAIIA